MATPRLGLVVEDKPTELSCKIVTMPGLASGRRRNRAEHQSSSTSTWILKGDYLWDITRSFLVCSSVGST